VKRRAMITDMLKKMIDDIGDVDLLGRILKSSNHENENVM
jgi:hypothetical protein